MILDEPKAKPVKQEAKPETAEDVRQKVLVLSVEKDKLKKELEEAIGERWFAVKGFNASYDQLSKQGMSHDEIHKDFFFKRRQKKLATTEKNLEDATAAFTDFSSTVHDSLEYKKKVKNIVATKKLDAGRRKATQRAVKLMDQWMGWDVKTDAVRTRRRRAFNSKGIANLPIHSGTEVALHELGHSLEYFNPDALESAVKFLTRRTAGKIEIDITPHKGKRKETALDGGFYDKYCGRLYRYKDDQIKIGGTGKKTRGYKKGGYTYQATEITSMGLEALLNDPIDFAKKDPDYFNFMINLLRGDFKEAK